MSIARRGLEGRGSGVIPASLILWILGGMHGAEDDHYKVVSALMADFPGSADLDASGDVEPRTGTRNAVEASWTRRFLDERATIFAEGEARVEAGPWILGDFRREGGGVRKEERLMGLVTGRRWREDSSFQLQVRGRILELAADLGPLSARAGRIRYQASRQKLLDPFAFATSPRSAQWSGGAAEGIGAAELLVRIGDFDASALVRPPRGRIQSPERDGFLLRIRDAGRARWSLAAGSHREHPFLGGSGSLAVGDAGCDASVVLLEGADETLRPRFALAVATAAMLASRPWNGWIEVFAQHGDFVPAPLRATESGRLHDDFLDIPFGTGLAAGTQWEMHPLFILDLGGLLDLEHRSGLLAPGLSVDLLSQRNASVSLRFRGQIAIVGEDSPLGGVDVPEGRIRAIQDEFRLELEVAL